MNLNVKRKDCKFIVKPEDRVVVCVIESRPDFMIRDLVLDFIHDNTSGRVDIIPWGRIADKLEMPSTFMGKAVCSKDDTWNEELGKKIAYSRAKNKLYTSFFKRANLFVNAVDRDLGELMDKFNNLGVALDANRTKLENDIEDDIQG